MKINYNNQDLRNTNYGHGYSCILCAFNSIPNVHYCSFLCHTGKVWIKDIFNSDIFRL